MTYQEEMNRAFEKVYNNTFKAAFQKPTDQKSEDEKKLLLEIYVTTDCNQSCSYCYLCKHGDELYPKEFRKPEIIVRNFKIFMNYLLDNKMYYPERFDFFTGEIWGTKLGYDLFDVLLDAIDKGFSPTRIIIPSNLSFILNDETLNKIDEYINKFEQRNIQFAFSCSNDGLYNDVMTRPLNNPEADAKLKKGTAEYYEKLFKYCKKRGFGFHPMVSAHGIKYWKENFKWWQEQLRKYDMDPLNSVMFLEVRNDDWTDEAIRYYLEYLDYTVEYFWRNYFKNPDVPVDELFSAFIHGRSKINKPGNYQPTTLPRGKFNPGCTIARSLVIRLGDLAIPPCHRTSYDEFIFGKFELDEDATKIIGLTAKNTFLMNQIWLNNFTGMSKCNCCPYNSFCMKGCYGSQFESTGEILYPCESVCELYQARILFLYEKYLKKGILNLEGEDKELAKLIQQVKNSKEYEKWMPIIQSIIS